VEHGGNARARIPLDRCQRARILIYFDLLDRLGPIEINLVSYVAPVFAAVSGWLFLNEAITSNTVAGFLIICVGFALVKRAAFRDARSASTASSSGENAETYETITRRTLGVVLYAPARRAGMFPETIETDRLRLEPRWPENVDLDDCYRICASDPGIDEVTEYVTWDPTRPKRRRWSSSSNAAANGGRITRRRATSSAPP